MNIQFIRNQNFCAKRLYSAKIQDKLITDLAKNVKVDISELEPNDVALFSQRDSYLEQTKFGPEIIEDFLAESRDSSLVGKKKRYIVVENTMWPEKNKHLGIAVANVDSMSMFLNRLQSISCGEMNLGLKGIGNCIMYAFIKMAQENKLNTISLSAINEKTAQFYRKLKFYPTELFGLNYSLHKSRFEDVAKELETRYLIKTKDTI